MREKLPIFYQVRPLSNRLILVLFALHKPIIPWTPCSIRLLRERWTIGQVNDGQQSAPSLLQTIIYQVYRIENSFSILFKIQFAWCSGYCHVIANKKAHRLAKKKTKKGNSIQPNQQTPPLLQTVALSNVLALFSLSQYAQPANLKTGKFTKSFDKAPALFQHNRFLYNGKPKHQAAPSSDRLAQLLHSPLSYFKIIYT